MNKQLAVVMVMLMTVFIGFGIIIPVMPELVKSVDPGKAEIHNALMLSIYSAVSFLLSPIWGGLSDRIGRRPIILIGVLGFAASFLLFGLASDNLSLMYASRVLGGLFSGAVTSVIVAYVADITPPEQRTKGMGLVGMSIGLGFTFGPAFGGFLSRISLETPFFAAAALAAIIFGLALIMLKESLPEEKRHVSTEKAPSRWTAFTGPLKYLYVLAFFVTFSLAGLESTLQFFGMARFAVTPYQFGIMFFVCGLVGALVQGGVVRRRVKSGQEPAYIAAGLVISAIGFFLLVTAHSLWTATLFLAIFGVGNALIRPCVTSLITQKTKVGQGVASGLSSSMDSLGRIIGPLVAAGLFRIELTLPLIVGGILSLMALLLLSGFRVADKKMAGAE
ncbi:MFS transporter [Paenibacillus darwinianus]|uniref:MFS transporter n=1 Tax=Paenibacillus darwinianus TaxID=1380763 RepID=A0A9W5S1N0_9BACL|nr:tetracycline resistance MFS efflux pump [Paenibacillus darwinianus]EXX85566.1 MFS transporter [Paenibacillus darwinianus]EXX88304.1 MFS transporter [Paenibacillus darwinianus]EXX89837.1 MFS transporter [Paenibacillus darwinianus]